MGREKEIFLIKKFMYVSLECYAISVITDNANYGKVSTVQSVQYISKIGRNVLVTVST